MSLPWVEQDKELKERIAEGAALLDLRGIGINSQVDQLAKEYDLTLTRTRLLALKKHPKYLEIKKKVIESEFEAGTLDLKKMAVDLLPEVRKCLESKLKEGDVKAAGLVITLFTNKDEEGPKQAQQIQVIMPGGKNDATSIRNKAT